MKTESEINRRARHIATEDLYVARDATYRANTGGEGLFDEPGEETELDEDENFEEEEDW